MNNTTTKSMVNLSTSKISLLILSLLLFNPSLLTAQDSPDELLEFMERLEGADMDGGMGTLNTEDGYKSFVQNEFPSGNT